MEYDLQNMANQLTHLNVIYQNQTDQIINQPGRRFEDVKFSPSNNFIALADYGLNQIVLLNFTYLKRSSSLCIVDCRIITSDTLCQPHGLDFIDDMAIVVANRAGNTIEVYQVPSVSCHQVPTQSITYPAASTVTIKGDRCLVCSNSNHTVSEFLIDQKGQLLVPRGILIPDGLNIPDGVAISSSGHRIAVSDHATHRVLIFDKSGKPVGTLSGSELSYPHGLCFSLDQKKIYVADAGEQTLKIFESENGEWIGPQETVKDDIKVIHDHPFALGRISPEEGGGKGLGIDRTGRLLVVTCEYQPIRWYRIRPNRSPFSSYVGFSNN